MEWKIRSLSLLRNQSKIPSLKIWGMGMISSKFKHYIDHFCFCSLCQCSIMFYWQGSRQFIKVSSQWMRSRRWLAQEASWSPSNNVVDHLLNSNNFQDKIKTQNSEYWILKDDNPKLSYWSPLNPGTVNDPTFQDLRKKMELPWWRCMVTIIFCLIFGTIGCQKCITVAIGDVPDIVIIVHLLF